MASNNNNNWIFSILSDLSIPFSQWTKQQVCGWLEDYGLGQYVNLTRQWVESGQTLLSATPQEIEKVRDEGCTAEATSDLLKNALCLKFNVIWVSFLGKKTLTGHFIRYTLRLRGT